MGVILVTRHDGALEWVRRHYSAHARHVAHLDAANLAALQVGDTVIGTLPVNLIADVNTRGAKYRHLVLDVPVELRGKNLTADDMERCGARLETYYASRGDER